MNSNLFKAIYTLFATSNTFNTATSGRFAFSTAPDDWTDKFAVVQGLDAIKEDCFRQTVYNVAFQINLFAVSRDDCWDLLDKCTSLFDRTNLTITGHYPSKIIRDTLITPIWNEVDNLYQATANFNIMLQST